MILNKLHKSFSWPFQAEHKPDVLVFWKRQPTTNWLSQQNTNDPFKDNIPHCIARIGSVRSLNMPPKAYLSAEPNMTISVSTNQWENRILGWWPISGHETSPSSNAMFFFLVFVWWDGENQSWRWDKIQPIVERVINKSLLVYICLEVVYRLWLWGSCEQFNV